MRHSNTYRIRLIPVLIVFLCLALLPAAPARAERLKTFTNSVGMKFVLIPAGSFIRGREDCREGERYKACPQRRITISKPFLYGGHRSDPGTVAAGDGQQVHGRLGRGEAARAFGELV